MSDEADLDATIIPNIPLNADHLMADAAANTDSDYEFFRYLANNGIAEPGKLSSFARSQWLKRYADFQKRLSSDEG